MSSARSAVHLTLELVPSRILFTGFTACHLLALTGLLICDLPVLITLPLGVLVVMSLVFNGIHYGNRRSRWFIDQVSCTVDGQWRLRTADGRERAAHLLDSSYVHPYLVILNFALGPLTRRSVVLLPDSADPEDLRRLRVRLLTGQWEWDEPE